MKIALDGNGRFHGIVIGVFLALTPGQPLSRDRYFKEDYDSSAQYLKLSVDGRNEMVDRHHAGVWVTDRGRWLVEDDGTFLFESDHRIRSIVAPVGGVSFSAHFEPTTSIGGDYYDVFNLDKARLAVAIGDVSGHGLSTGLVMAMVKAAITTLVEEGAAET